MSRSIILLHLLSFFLFSTTLFPLTQLLPSAVAAEMEENELFKGKRMTILVQYAPGGSFDVHARWMARHLPRITGAKTIVQNLPGGGGVIGYNKLYRSKPDGLTLLTAHTKLVAFDIFKRKGVKYDFNKFTYLGKVMKPDTAILINKNLPSNLNELRKMDKIRIGASSPFYEGLWAEALGLKNITIVPGYGGFSGRIAAILRGELDATSGSVTSAFKYTNAVKVLVVIRPDKRIPEVPDLKMVNAPQPWSDYLKSFSGLMRAVVTTPNLSPRKRKFLVSALRSLTTDKKAVKEAKRMKLQLTWLAPEKLRDQAEVFTRLKEEEVKNLKHVIERKYVGVKR